ncbi:A/G-specific adenine glycosylase [Telmatospirillum siberiense]|uniref:Adenine DNA glycosylase n=1 Tax=Telmatospirillum siberiense TaxID=382514 RepID=A0A2N3PTP9_9PROT|nr:A/G-specific adenine glycosylase [Telmatospirillum siberiense]PKU23766.1 A/G-specific adenine glycosylase [Telmatospirillum siberiense]
MPHATPAALSKRILAWYDRNARVLPWRAPPGRVADPYHVWLSEIMLQQTTVVAVAPYFLTFIKRWPTVKDLAAASLDDILTAWAGLGYYARARNLHKCAQLVAEWRDGVFPDEEEALRGLPGIGDYTAAAIAAIAHGRPAVVMDGNIERVIARMFAVTDPLPAVKPKLKALAAGLTPSSRPGDYAQALMDLGATVCTPRQPACVLCPWLQDCDASHQGIADELPAKLAKPARPTRRGLAFWTLRKDGAVLLRRRPESGLLGGMMEIPSTPWRAEPWDLAEARDSAPVAAEWRPLSGMVTHTFTHFHLELLVVAGRARTPELAKGLWCPLDGLGDQALPTVMRKVVRHALAKAY